MLWSTAGRARCICLNVAPMKRSRADWFVRLCAVFALTACNPMPETPPVARPTVTPSIPIAPKAEQPTALFYAKAGSLYVSEPAGTPGRKLTDGPADTQPAPSPDLTHVAFVRKANTSDYGGELWMLDLSSGLTPLGAPRRLIDPATLPPTAAGLEASMIVSPRWSPTGERIAFLDNHHDGIVGGGRLLVADTDTGAVPADQPNLDSGSDYSWAPNGRRIAWINARSDVSPVSVNVFGLSAASVPVVHDANATSVTFGKDSQTVIFTNGDASGPQFTGIPFAIRAGGIYSVAAPDATAAGPVPLYSTPGFYFNDIAALNAGGVAFTSQGADNSSRTIDILDPGSSMPRTAVTTVADEGQGPVWGEGGFVAYLAPGGSLIVTDAKNSMSQKVDSGVDAFAWPAQPNGSTSGG